MKPSQAADLLQKLIPAKEPLLLVGPPGVGKTSLLEQAAEALGYGIMISHPVVSDPTDYKGMPAITHIDGVPTAGFYPFGDLRQMAETKEDLLVIFDDLGQALPANQAAIMQLILGRQVNGQRISKKVQFVAATNRRQDKAAVGGLITPLLDRFTTIIEILFDLEDWIKWGHQSGMPAILMSFARFKPDLIGKFEPSSDMKKQPTPRSVAGLGRLIKRGIYDVEVLAGAVGDGFAGEFLEFYRTAKDMPSVQDIYRDPFAVAVPERPDVMYALMGALAHGAEESTVIPTVQFLKRCKPEFAVGCVRDILSRNEDLKTNPAIAMWVASNTRMFG